MQRLAQTSLNSDSSHAHNKPYITPHTYLMFPRFFHSLFSLWLTGPSGLSCFLTGSHLLLKLSTEVSVGILAVIVWNRLKLASDSGSFCLRLANAEIKARQMRSPGAGVTCRCPAAIRKVSASNCTGVFCMSCACSCWFRSLSLRVEIFYIAENDSELSVLLCLPSAGITVCTIIPLYDMLWVDPRASCTVDKYYIPTGLCPQALAIFFPSLSLRFPKTVCIW